MENKKLIDELYLCAAQCTHCYDACLLEKDKDKLQRCMMLDQDCADICRLTGHILERSSESANKFLELCAEICSDCAEECEKHSDMEHCKRCAEVCRQCSEMCSKANTTA
jgi:hypothetical protein